MNRIASYALALVLGLSVASTAAFAADMSSQDRNASQSSQVQTTQQSGIYDGPSMFNGSAG
jgi:hypothetical protein